MTAGDFDALFDAFATSVVRLEALPRYDVGGAEGDRIAAWRAGKPRPLRTVRTDPWLARIATSTVLDGKDWRRARIVDDPLTDYQRYQVTGSYRESQSVGEQVTITLRPSVDDEGPDFWLFDDGLPGARGAVMRYDDAGHWLGWELVDDPAELRAMAVRVERVLEQAVSLNEYLASEKVTGRG